MPQMAESRRLATSAFFSASRSLNPVVLVLFVFGGGGVYWD